jgi:predicted AlkP superfamily phosphohydrolase/phosphomutase
MTRSRILRALVGLALCSQLVAITGCGEGPGGDRHRRALIVGIDGATMRIADPLLDEGRLPNLARIAREGVMGPLRSEMPIRSPRIWNTIATGKTAAKHGIVDFTRKTSSGERRLLLSHDRRAHALWNIASDAGLGVSVVNFWNTYPPERINGVMVSDHLIAREIAGREEFTGATNTPIGPVVHPAEWQSTLSGLMATEDDFNDFPSPFQQRKLLPRWTEPDKLERYFQEDAALARFAFEIIQQTEPDVMFVLLPGVDRVSHHLWACIEPEGVYTEKFRMSPLGREACAQSLRRYYVYADGLIGKLLTLYDAGDLVIVLSDHGFEAGVDLKVISGVHKSEAAVNGIFFARGEGIPASQIRLSGLSIFDIAPTVLAWLGIPVGQDMDGRVAPFLTSPRAERIARVPSHDGTPVERVSSDPSGVDDTLMQQLQSLGYFE